MIGLGIDEVALVNLTELNAGWGDIVGKVAFGSDVAAVESQVAFGSDIAGVESQVAFGSDIAGVDAELEGIEVSLERSIVVVDAAEVGDFTFAMSVFSGLVWIFVGPSNFSGVLKQNLFSTYYCKFHMGNW